MTEKNDKSNLKNLFFLLILEVRLGVKKLDIL